MMQIYLRARAFRRSCKVDFRNKSEVACSSSVCNIYMRSHPGYILYTGRLRLIFSHWFPDRRITDVKVFIVIIIIIRNTVIILSKFSIHYKRLPSLTPLPSFGLYLIEKTDGVSSQRHCSLPLLFFIRVLCAPTESVLEHLSYSFIAGEQYTTSVLPL